MDGANAQPPLGRSIYGLRQRPWNILARRKPGSRCGAPGGGEAEVRCFVPSIFGRTVLVWQKLFFRGQKGQDVESRPAEVSSGSWEKVAFGRDPRRDGG